MRVVLDTEWNGLADATTCHLIVCRDLDNPKDVYIFEQPSKDWGGFRDFASGVDTWVGHNVIGYDIPLLQKSVPGLVFAVDRVVDTLVLSRLLNFHIEGGHSLEAWGPRLPKKLLDFGSPVWYPSKQEGRKIEERLDTDDNDKEASSIGGFAHLLGDYTDKFEKVKITDWSTYTKDMLFRCISDTVINWGVYKHFERYLSMPAFALAVPAEMATAFLCNELHKNGFAFDRAGAATLLDELSVRLSALDVELKTAFPPVKVFKKTITPRLTKALTINAVDLKQLVAAGFDPFTIMPDKAYDIYDTVEFNPGSHKQIIERLNDAGWKPTEKTLGHREAVKTKGTPRDRLDHFKVYGWTLDDENLATLPDTAPVAAKRLVERLLLRSRVSLLEAWLGLVVDHGDHQRIHGTFQGIGAWTHRFSHQKPNMANVPKRKKPPRPSDLAEFSNQINDRMRAFWTARPGFRLIGVDADAIHMRIFAHLCQDAALIDAIVNGNKDLGTDIHSFNMRLLGSVCASREVAKTFIYALLNGAGAGKCAEIFKCPFDAAKAALDLYIERLPGFKALKKERFPADLKRGYFEGIDGRLVVCDDPRNIMSGYLQSGEIVVMKGAAIIWNEKLSKEGLPYYYVDAVHDEWQTEVIDDEDLARYAIDCQLLSLRDMGDRLSLRCPIAGTAVYSLDGHRFATKQEIDAGIKNEFAGGYNWKITH